MIPRRISFARTLPILAFLLSYVIIAVPATMAYINVKSASRNGSDVIVRTRKFQVRIPHEHFLRRSIQAGADVTSHTIQALNLPAFSIELAVDRAAKAWPTTWTPPGLDFLEWRALAFPIYCLPFWWLAGLGLDALSGTRRLRWWTLLIGSLLWGFFLFLLCGLYFGLSPSERMEMVYPYWGFAIWVSLFAAFPYAWVNVWLTSRRPATVAT